MHPKSWLAVALLLPLAALAAPLPEETLQGRWRDADRHSLIEFTRGPDGLWVGTTVEASRREEVGTHVFRALAWDSRTATFRGLLIKPDDAAGATMEVILTLASETSATAVVKKFIFTKTILLTRER